MFNVETGGLISVPEGKIVVDVIKDPGFSDEAVVRSAILVPASCAGGKKVFLAAICTRKDGKFHTFIVLYRPGSGFYKEIAFAFEYGMLHRTITPGGRYTTPAIVADRNTKGVYTVDVKNKVTNVETMDTTLKMKAKGGFAKLSVDSVMVELAVEAAYHTLQTALEDDELGMPMTHSDMGADRFVDITEGVYRRMREYIESKDATTLSLPAAPEAQ